MPPADVLVRWAPFAIAAAALAVGAGLALSAAGPAEVAETAPPALDTAGEAPSAATPAEAEEPTPQAPDLSGPDLGERVAATEPAHGLAVFGDRLVWLATDGATLLDAPAAGGEPRALWKSAAPESFGGAFAASAAGVFWAVERTDGAAGTVLFAATTALAPGLAPELVAEVSSADPLLARDEEVCWSERGRIACRRAGKEPAVVLERSGRIAAAARVDDNLYWLEIAYEQGARGSHELYQSNLESPKARRLARLSAPAERRSLLATSEALVFAESADEGWRLVRVPSGGGAPRTLATTGEISALIEADGGLIWAETHEQDGEPVSLLWRLPAGASRPERLGRDTGAVSALAVSGRWLYWSAGNAIKRHRLEGAT